MTQRKAEFYLDAVAALDGGKVNTQWRIREWKPVYTKILVLLGKGMTPVQVAQEAEIGYTSSQINRIRKDPLFRLKMAQYAKKLDVAIIERGVEETAKFPEVELARNKLLEASEKAADTLTALLNVDINKISEMTIHEKRLLAGLAQDVLNRTGLKEIVTDESNKPGREYSPEEIRSALDNAKELEAIAERLDGRGSSYVLSREERSGIEHTEAPETTDVIEPPFSIQTPEESVAPEQTVADEESIEEEK